MIAGQANAGFDFAALGHGSDLFRRISTLSHSNMWAVRDLLQDPGHPVKRLPKLDSTELTNADVRVCGGSRRRRSDRIDVGRRVSVGWGRRSHRRTPP